ncbi:hypothetical protein HYH03_014415 [Edaphochlamys debaryana]|uniref:ATP-dependent RNA helicase n=1 Tax=Edaphochlamys debaryana TaxID=47281 RepID=A0A835XN26_9CHLO|nr:hypothetical protein HYH03_014415 [Edaphochlamys debaryana]|eukprot:KAG2486916.1 hypothetical protein HYH03_014415 [Edaphochlamys debaryana]
MAHAEDSPALDNAIATATEKKHKPRERRAATAGPPGLHDGANAPASAKAGPVLPWMRVPITIRPGSGVAVGSVLGLDPRLAEALKTGFHFTELFPVQAAVWQHSAGGLSTAHDLCVAAPTGSGKTLAYALPLVNALAVEDGWVGRMGPDWGGGREGGGKTLAYALPLVNALAVEAAGPPHGRAPGRRLLRGLVVLPTRDLAAQVHAVLQPLCAAVGLRAALAAARTTEAAEAAELVGAGTHAASGHAASGHAASGPGLGPGSGAAAGAGGGGGGGCGADVAVATPGRLMAHLGGTPGFTLRHLRFLVVDETDRLLRQSYQEWLPGVLSQIGPQHAQHGAGHSTEPLGGGGSSGGRGAGGGLEGGGEEEGAGAHFGAAWPQASAGTALPFSRPRAVKIIVSATLTRDPAKLQRLLLHQPRFVATAQRTAMGGGGGAAGATAGGPEGRYSLPRSLAEFRLLVSAARKPLALLALLCGECVGQSTIVFTSSVDMTHKLYLMLRAVEGLGDKVVEYSSHVPPRERAAGLDRFRAGGASVLVASDAMTRGMDVEHVAHVINYDAPVYAKTYVHRAGRTARAGKSGRVITLLRDEDMRHFKAMIRKADNNFVREMKLPPEQVEGFRPALQGALQQLEALLAAERAADVGLAQQQGLVEANQRARQQAADRQQQDRAKQAAVAEEAAKQQQQQDRAKEQPAAAEGAEGAEEGEQAGAKGGQEPAAPAGRPGKRARGAGAEAAEEDGPGTSGRAVAADASAGRSGKRQAREQGPAPNAAAGQRSEEEAAEGSAGGAAGKPGRRNASGSEEGGGGGGRGGSGAARQLPEPVQAGGDQGKAKKRRAT